MDLTSNDLTELVRQYDEQYCTSAGECVVFKYDKKKASAVSRRFYVGAGVSYASYAAPDYDARRNSSFSGNTYSGIAPTFIAGADFMFPRFSRFFMAQMELSYTPHRYEASKEMLEGGNPKMTVSELALRFGASYAFCHDCRIRPYVKGGLHLAWNSGMKEKDAAFRYDYGGDVRQTTGDLKYDNELRCGIYLGAGADRPEREKLRHPDNSIFVHVKQGLRHIRQPFNKHPAPRHLHRQRQKDGRQVKRIGAFQRTYIHLRRSGKLRRQRTNVSSVSLEGVKWQKCNYLQKCEIFELHFFGTKPFFS